MQVTCLYLAKPEKMMSYSTNTLRRSHFFLLVLLISLVLLGCNGETPPQTALPTPSETRAPEPADTAAPTPSPSPSPPKVILLAPAQGDAGLSSQMQTLLTDLAAQSGLRFQLRPDLSADEMQDVQIVVALPPTQGLSELAAAYPEVQFVAYGIPDIEPGANLSLIGTQAERPDQLGFTAGYTAAAITPDYRAGILTAAGSPEGQAMRQGFINGVFYFCGLCRPVYPPFPTTGYPITLELPAAATPADWQAVTNMLLSWQVGTVFVDPAIADPKLLELLAESDIHLILAGPPPEALSKSWVASLDTADPVQQLQAAWPALLKGESNPSLQQQLGFLATNPDLLSPGKQLLVENMLADLLAGFIDTGVDPATWQGE